MILLRNGARRFSLKDYKSGRGSRAGSTKMHPFKDLDFSEVFSISRGGTKFG